MWKYLEKIDIGVDCYYILYKYIITMEVSSFAHELPANISDEMRESLICYLSQMDDKDRITYEIARDHLKTSLTAFR